MLKLASMLAIFVAFPVFYDCVFNTTVGVKGALQEEVIMLQLLFGSKESDSNGFIFTYVPSPTLIEFI